MTSEPQEQDKNSAFKWHKHVGLLASVGATILICLKLLAVAGWDSTTAFGILAANGTANVLTGNLLALLPTLYAALAFAIAPRIERYLARRTTVERAAAGLMGFVPVTLLLLIVPAMLLLICIILLIILAVIQQIQTQKSVKKTQAVNDTPSEFERISVDLGALMILAFPSLSTPWLPPETIFTANGEQTAYVLKTEGNTTTVLMAKDRTFTQVQTNTLTHKYCTFNTEWWDEPILRISAGDKYPHCVE